MAALFFVFYLLLPAACLIGVRKRRPSDSLDHELSEELRGLGMLLIVMAHAVKSTDNYATFFFFVSAILGVGACFLLSGYGLYKSLKAKTGYLDHFLAKKFSRVLIPFVLLFLLSLFFDWIHGDELRLRDILLNFVTLRFEGSLLWYLKIQLLLYVFFFLAFRFFSGSRAIAAVFVLTVSYIVISACCGLKSYWYNTCLFFPLGVLLARYDYAVLPVITKKTCVAVSSIIFVLLFCFIFFFGRLNLEYLIDTAYILTFLAAAVGFFSYWRGSRVLSFFGKRSMEVYLIHTLLLKRDLFGIFSPEKAWTYLLLLGATALAGWLLFPIDNWLAKKLLPERKAL